jgi:hypothetical protein
VWLKQQSTCFAKASPFLLCPFTLDYVRVYYGLNCALLPPTQMYVEVLTPNAMVLGKSYMSGHMVGALMIGLVPLEGETSGACSPSLLSCRQREKTALCKPATKPSPNLTWASSPRTVKN